MTARAARALGDRIELAPLERKERQDAIGFAERSSTQYDSARLIGAGLRQRPPVPLL